MLNPLYRKLQAALFQEETGNPVGMLSFHLWQCFIHWRWYRIIVVALLNKHFSSDWNIELMSLQTNQNLASQHNYDV